MVIGAGLAIFFVLRAKKKKGDAPKEERIKVDTSLATSTYHFWGLPKYDAEGLNVHYTVTESWVAGHAPDPEAKLTVKTRYRQKDTPCRLADVSAENFTLLFDDEPQWAATPGQSAVLYRGDVVMGGGFIQSILP